jgi:subtilisin family serine protease
MGEGIKRGGIIRFLALGLLFASLIFSAQAMYISSSDIFHYLGEYSSRNAYMNSQNPPKDLSFLFDKTDLSAISWHGEDSLVEMFIIELQEEPMISKNKKILDELNIDDKISFRNSQKHTGSLSVISADKKMLIKKISDHEKVLEEEHRNFQKKFQNKFSGNSLGHSQESSELKSEYKLVFNGFSAYMTEDQAEEVQKLPEVKKIYKSKKFKALLNQSVPLIQNGILAGGLDENGNSCVETNLTCLTGANITIAIIDTGVDYNHSALGNCTTEQFLEGNCSKVIGGFDFVNNDADPIDDNGHGTHCASIAAGNGTLKGVASEATILAYKVLDDWGYGTSEWIISAMERAVLDGADIISMSLGGSGNPNDAESIAVDNAVADGVVVVIAAGNDGEYASITSPGNARDAITVGSANIEREVSSFSSRGPVLWEDEEDNRNYLVKPDILAPGEYICAAMLTSSLSNNTCLSEYIEYTGTSMAAPHVAGAAALLLQKNPLWNPAEIKMALRNSADDLGEDLFIQGYGLINLSRALSINQTPVIARINSSYFPQNLSDIIGTASGSNFVSYEVLLSDDGIIYELICNGSSEVNDGVLCSNFSPINQTISTYWIKLIVYDNLNYESIDYGYYLVKNAKVLFPVAGRYYNLYDSIPLEVEIYTNASLFNVDLADFFSQEQIAISGITILNSTSGVWNASHLEEGYYTLRFQFTDGINYFMETIEPVYLTPALISANIKSGWPVDLGSNVGIALITADLENDGYKEIITKNNKSIHVFNFSGGNVSMWPVQFECGLDDIFNPSQFAPLSALDVNNDTLPEIFAGTCSYNNDSFRSPLNLYNANGSSYQGWPADIMYSNASYLSYNYSTFMEHSFAMSEYGIFGYGEFYIYSNATDNDTIDYLYLFGISPNGSALDGAWPVLLSENTSRTDMLARTVASPALGDMNNDGEVDIVAVFSKNTSVNGTVNSSNNYSISTEFWTLDMQGNIINNFSINSSLVSPINLVDWDYDGELEILASMNHNENYGIYVFKHNGTIVNFYDIYASTNSLAFGNFDNDSDYEIFLGLDYFDCTLFFILDNEEELMDGWPIGICAETDFELGIKTMMPPIVADIDGDNILDVLLSVAEGEIYGLNSTGGLILFEELDEEYTDSGIVVDDIDGDGFIDIIVASSNTNVPGKIYVWETNTTYNASNVFWPMFQHDSAHTGCAGNCESRLSINGTCGSLAREYLYTETQWPSSDYCVNGTLNVQSVSFMDEGQNAQWTCLGNYTGANVNCSASRTSAPAPVSFSSNGGGMGGSAPAPKVPATFQWTQTLDYKNHTWEKGKLSAKLSLRERISINYSGELHHIGVLNITASSVFIQVQSVTQNKTLTIGETSEFDINGDGSTDIKITLNSIVNSTANITIDKKEAVQMADIINSVSAQENNPDNLIQSANTALNTAPAEYIITPLANVSDESKIFTKKIIKIVIISIGVLAIFALAIFIYAKSNTKKKVEHKRIEKENIQRYSPPDAEEEKFVNVTIKDVAQENSIFDRALEEKILQCQIMIKEKRIQDAAKIYKEIRETLYKSASSREKADSKKRILELYSQIKHR